MKGDFTLASAEKTAGGWAYELAPVSAMMRKALKSVRLRRRAAASRSSPSLTREAAAR